MEGMSQERVSIFRFRDIFFCTILPETIRDMAGPAGQNSLRHGCCRLSAFD